MIAKTKTNAKDKQIYQLLLKTKINAENIKASILRSNKSMIAKPDQC